MASNEEYKPGKAIRMAWNDDTFIALIKLIMMTIP